MTSDPGLSCREVQSLCFHRLLSTITEPTSSGPCDPALAEEAASPPLVSEESEVDRTDHGGSKKVCFKVCEEDQEDSGHDTMSYRDSYRWGQAWLAGVSWRLVWGHSGGPGCGEVGIRGCFSGSRGTGCYCLPVWFVVLGSY